MATIKTNIWNLEVGDIICFTNKAQSEREILVDRVEEKSWYTHNGKSRNSYGTLSEYAKYPDFRIIKNN